MNAQTVPVVKDLVLVGGGHTHVAVLRRFGMRPLPGVRLTVISRDVHTPYSGMLPGLIAGHYDFDEVHIDLGPLSRFAGARLYHAAVTGIDPDRRLVLCEGRPPVPYDLLSINVGSTPSFRAVPGAAGVVVPVKPIGAFVQRWERLCARVAAADRPLAIAVVGAGAGGVELTLAAQFALRRLLAERGRPQDTARFHLFGASAAIVPTHNRGMRRRLERALRERGVQLHLGAAVTAVAAGRLTLAGGGSVPADEILWVTQAGAAPWLAAAGLDVDGQGFVRVDDTLQSLSHPGIFAAGDVAAVVNHPREKAGVFAVQARPAAGRESQTRAARPPAAAVPAPAPVSDPGLDRRSSRGRRAGLVVGRRRRGLALEGPHRPPFHGALPRSARHGPRRGAGARPRSGGARGAARDLDRRDALRRLRLEGRRHPPRPGARPAAAGAARRRARRSRRPR